MHPLPLTLENLTAWDTETWLITPGNLTPRLVCATEADAADPPRIYDRDQARAEFRALLKSGRHLVGANIFYDLGVHVATDPDRLPLVFAAIEAGRIHTVDVLEALHDIGRGCLYTEGGRPFGRYSLELLERRYLHRDRSEEKHGEDAWRMRYAELDGVPLGQWPQEAIDYPRRDAQGTFDVGAIQLGLRPWLVDNEIEPRLNLQCEIDEIRAGWALQLAHIYGMRTDGPLVARTVAHLREEHERSRRVFFGAGITRVATVGKDQDPDDIGLDWVRGALGVMRDQLSDARARGDEAEVAWRARRVDDLVSAERALGRGKRIRWAADTKRLAELVTTAYLGQPPLTDTQRVSTSRDTLEESGHEILEAYGEAGAGEKHLSAFADVLVSGTVAPITPSTRILTTGRYGYARPNLTQLPREGHIRECFTPREGCVYCSVDYGAQELVALGEVQIQLFGHSALADALNAGQDLHLRLAGRIAGLTFEEALARHKAKDKRIKNLRQAAKPINFGLPGLMGVAKLVLTARKQGVRFCELAGELDTCGSKGKVTNWRGRAIPPTCSVCLELAAQYVRLWKEEWPEMGPYLEIGPSLVDQGYAIESLGNRMTRLEASAGAYSNHLFQNLAAQSTKAALWRITRECLVDDSSPLYGHARPVTMIHDETILEIAEEHITPCAERQALIMVEEMRRFTPHVKVTAVPAVARRWFKGMELLRDRDGQIVPWWPHDPVTHALNTDMSRGGWCWAPDLDRARADLARVAWA